MGRKGLVLRFVQPDVMDLLSFLTGRSHLIHRDVAVNGVVYVF
jgi:hypothetical protein